MVREFHHGGSERQMTEVALSLDRGRFAPHIGAFIVRGIRAYELRAASVNKLCGADCQSGANWESACRL